MSSLHGSCVRAMVILEANAHQLLLPTDDEGQNNVTENYFLH